MTDKIMINGVDVNGCKNFISNYERHHNIDGSITYNNACECGIQGVENYQLECNYNDCYYKQLKRKEEECEKLKEKLKPKLKNAHCTYFEGQTGECRAKEFKKCNPVNCKLYTVDELSTILDLQEQLQAEQQKVSELRKANEEKNEFLQHLGISSGGEFKRIKHYIDKLQEQNKSLQQELRAEKQKVGELEVKLEFFPIIEARKNEEKTLRIQLEEKVKELEEKSDKYKHALEEIKVYITNSYCLENYSIIETAKLAKQILRKCEVLDD